MRGVGAVQGNNALPHRLQVLEVAVALRPILCRGRREVWLAVVAGRCQRGQGQPTHVPVRIICHCSHLRASDHASTVRCVRECWALVSATTAYK